MGSRLDRGKAVASNKQCPDDLDASKIPEPQPTFLHSALDGTHAHVEFVRDRFEAALVAHEGVDQALDGFGLASNSWKISFIWSALGIAF